MYHDQSNHRINNKMNTIQIQGALQQLKVQSPGVFPADKIPRVLTRPTSCVFNTDIHIQPGSHWVALFIDKRERGIFFDSYGMLPLVPQHLKSIQSKYYLIQMEYTAITKFKF